MPSRLSLFALLFVFAFKSCPPKRPSSSQPPPPAANPGLDAYESYYTYFLQTPDSRNPNPAYPMEVSGASLIASLYVQSAVPTPLSAQLQNDFRAIVSRVPADHTPQVKGLSLKIARCSSGNQVLWSALQNDAGSNGSICISPVIIRAVFVDLAAGPCTNAYELVKSKGSPDPLAYNGDSTTLITNMNSKYNLGMTPGDISAAVSAMLDRLLHHGHVLKCGPRSWRTKMDAPEQMST